MSTRRSAPAPTGPRTISAARHRTNPHIPILNQMYSQRTAPAKDPRKTGPAPQPPRALLKGVARRLRQNSERKNRDSLRLIGAKPCQIPSCSDAGKDSNGNRQITLRVPHMKERYPKGIRCRPWHITWIAKYGLAPEEDGLQYSHRCGESTCVRPSHGVWEPDRDNKTRNYCRTASHVVLPDGKVIVVCPHEPECLTPVVISDPQDPRIRNPV